MVYILCTILCKVYILFILVHIFNVNKQRILLSLVQLIENIDICHRECNITQIIAKEVIYVSTLYSVDNNSISYHYLIVEGASNNLHLKYCIVEFGIGRVLLLRLVSFGIHRAKEARACSFSAVHSFLCDPWQSCQWQHTSSIPWSY